MYKSLALLATLYYEFVKNKKGKYVRKPTRLYAIVNHVFKNGGVGQGSTTIHVDTGEQRRWKY